MNAQRDAFIISLCKAALPANYANGKGYFISFIFKWCKINKQN